MSQTSTQNLVTGKGERFIKMSYSRR